MPTRIGILKVKYPILDIYPRQMKTYIYTHKQTHVFRGFTQNY